MIVECDVRLSRITLFNRYFTLVLIINLLIYTLQLNLHKNLLTGCLLIASWLTVFAFEFVNEVIRKIIKKSNLATSEVNFVLIRINAVLTSFLILTLTLTTGNTAFMVLYLIPILTTLFCSHTKFSIILFSIGSALLLFADAIGWLKSNVLIANKHIFMPSTLVLLGNLTLIGYLGILFSSQLRHSSEKASKFRDLASIDGLTGLVNRREFNKRISEEVSRAKRHRSALSIALFDIDHFKRINDTYGHNAGDKLLKELGELIRINTRDCDIAARYGGEEFALILPETSINEAYDLLERLRVMIEVHYFCMPSNPIQTSISIGVAQYEFLDACMEDFCERADKALYQAKKTGRNRVECAGYALPKLDLSRIPVAR